MSHCTGVKNVSDISISSVTDIGLLMNLITFSYRFDLNLSSSKIELDKMMTLGGSWMFF